MRRIRKTLGEIKGIKKGNMKNNATAPAPTKPDNKQKLRDKLGTLRGRYEEH